EPAYSSVSFDDLNFSSSGGEPLRKRFLEMLNHCSGEQFVSAIRRRIIERVVFTQYQLDCLHLYLFAKHPSHKLTPRRSWANHFRMTGTCHCAFRISARTDQTGQTRYCLFLRFGRRDRRSSFWFSAAARDFIMTVWTAWHVEHDVKCFNSSAA